MRRFYSLDTCQVSRWSAQMMGKQMFGLLFLCHFGWKCEVTHKLRPRCLQDIGLVSRLWFISKWTLYLLFTAKKHEPATTMTTPLFRLSQGEKVRIFHQGAAGTHRH